MPDEINGDETISDFDEKCKASLEIMQQKIQEYQTGINKTSEVQERLEEFYFNFMESKHTGSIPLEIIAKLNNSEARALSNGRNTSRHFEDWKTVINKVTSNLIISLIKQQISSANKLASMINTYNNIDLKFRKYKQKTELSESESIGIILKKMIENEYNMPGVQNDNTKTD